MSVVGEKMVVGENCWVTHIHMLNEACTLCIQFVLAVTSAYGTNMHWKSTGEAYSYKLVMDDTTAFLSNKENIAYINTNSKDRIGIVAIYTLYLKLSLTVKKRLILHIFYIKCVIFFNRYLHFVVVFFQIKYNKILFYQTG